MKKTKPFPEKKRCTVYDEITAGLYLDHEMNPKEIQAFEKHLSWCSVCRKRVETLKTVSQLFARGVDTQTSVSPSMEEEVIQKLKGSRTRFRKREILTSWKFYLQTASLAVITIITLVMFQGNRPIIEGPSAIVETVDGNVSSVMIFETRQDKHTIIWYKET